VSTYIPILCSSPSVLLPPPLSSAAVASLLPPPMLFGSVGENASSAPLWFPRGRISQDT
jgi:hypothetical protein